MNGLLDIPGDILISGIALLDGLPDYIRAMLAAVLLVVFLRFFEGRIPDTETQLSRSFRKTALVTMALIPLLVWLFPSSRMVVFVEELPRSADPYAWLWYAIVAIWLIGVLATLIHLLRSHWRTVREIRALPRMEDEKLNARVLHWQRRLGLTRELRVVQFAGDRPRNIIDHDRIGFPSAALHWPGNTQDIVIIQSICHLKLRHGGWHLFAQVMTCVYWPITWVQTLHARLLGDFRKATDRLAESCYQDQLGYARALRQLEARLTESGTGAQADPVAEPDRRMSVARIRAYGSRLSALLSRASEPPWSIEALLAEREQPTTLFWTDPYDRVVLFVGQAVFLAFLLTGVTLKEQPPDMEQRYSMPFELLWKQHFHRNQELMERTDREL